MRRKLLMGFPNRLKHFELPSVSGDVIPVYLKEHEIIPFLNELNDYCRAPAELSLRTGMRKGELLKLTWDMVSISKRKIVLPPSVTKSKRARIIPLSEEAIHLLIELKMGKSHQQPYVFTNPEKDGPRGDVRDEGLKMLSSELVGQSLRFIL